MNKSIYPKISIITPSFNQGQFLEATILSVLGQFYENLEYIIIDGGSTDNSVQIIEKYKNKLHFWCSEPDNGQAAAINRGFNIATGDVLMWLNSDDLLMPNVLEIIAEKYLENPNALYFGNCIHFENNKTIGTKADGSNVVFKHNNFKLNQMDYIIQPSSFWSKKIWTETGLLNENLYFSFDWDWFLRVQKKFDLIAIDECLSMYRIHESHKTGSGGSKRQDELLEIYKKYNPHFAELYGVIINDKPLKTNKYINFIFKRGSKIIRKNNAILQLKTFRYNKYKKFSFDDIEKIRPMV